MKSLIILHLIFHNFSSSNVPSIHEKINCKISSSGKIIAHKTYSPEIIGERKRCSKCLRAESICICSFLPDGPFDTNVRFIILQHPNEVMKGLTSSTPLVSMIIKDCIIIRGIAFNTNGDVTIRKVMNEKKFNLLSKGSPSFMESCCKVVNSEILTEAFSDKEDPPYLLYPGEESLDIDSIQTGSSTNFEKEGRKKTIIIIDGTWVQAKKIIRRSPTIVEHSKWIKISGSINSIINPIRRGNKDSCMSTLEAVAYSLKVLDGSPVSHNASTMMLKALSTVVEKQLHSWGRMDDPYLQHS